MAAISEQAGGATATMPYDRATALKWLLGVAGTWVILTLLVDLGETSDLAVALALVLAGSVVLTYGPEMFQALGIQTGGR